MFNLNGHTTALKTIIIAWAHNKQQYWENNTYLVYTQLMDWCSVRCTDISDFKYTNIKNVYKNWTKKNLTCTEPIIIAQYNI